MYIDQGLLMFGMGTCVKLKGSQSTVGAMGIRLCRGNICVTQDHHHACYTFWLLSTSNRAVNQAWIFLIKLSCILEDNWILAYWAFGNMRWHESGTLVMALILSNTQ